MNNGVTEFLVSPTGIICLILFLIVCLPLIKILIWKLFSFDSKVQDILFQKKSSEVRTGKVIETVAPFLDHFPVDVRKEGTSTVFIGQPIDYIHFDPDEGITFIEVKSANARLNSIQKRIIDHIEKGNVFWADMKVSGETDDNGA
jgi:predicted Holliday junction resolvase-like endonuclease